jgi:hypothetical protein
MNNQRGKRNWEEKLLASDTSNCATIIGWEDWNIVKFIETTSLESVPIDYRSELLSDWEMYPVEDIGLNEKSMKGEE